MSEWLNLIAQANTTIIETLLLILNIGKFFFYIVRYNVNLYCIHTKKVANIVYICKKIYNIHNFFTNMYNIYYFLYVCHISLH